MLASAPLVSGRVEIEASNFTINFIRKQIYLEFTLIFYYQIFNSSWRLMEDKQTCEPDPTFLTTTCSNTGMIIEIEGCDLVGNMSEIGFSADCLATVEGKLHSF